MSDVSELEERITAALTRIEQGLGKIAAPDDSTALATALEEERSANAQLEERVRALKDRQDIRIADLEDRVGSLREQMVAMDVEMQRLRASNADMREVNAQLRAVATDGTATPELINRAMLAEMEALHAQRSSEAAEVDAILAELKPMIEEV